MKKKKYRNNFDWEDSEVNPMDGMANLSDVMLCLAVGIMIALITHWNVDIGTGSVPTVNRGNAEELSEDSINKVNPEDANVNTTGEGFQELGKVYRDPQSGKIYMIPEE